MANKQNSTDKIIRNGFEAVTHHKIEITACIAYEQAEAMGALFRAIEKLSSDRDIRQLAKHGWGQADLQANDIDDLRTCVVKAGVIGYLADEVSSENDHSL